MVQLPKEEELQAWRLRRNHGLADHEIAQVLNIARETANRRIQRCEKKRQELLNLCSQAGPCGLVHRIFI